MQVSNSFFDVCRQYFEGVVLLPVVIVALIGLIRKWNIEKRKVFLVCVCVGTLFLYNDIAYRITGIIEETSSYYRFFWICPVALLISFLVTEIIYMVGKWQKTLIVMVLGIAIFMTSESNISAWANIPDNIYQMEKDVIQVADALMELTDGKPTTLAENGGLYNVIRQYNANICFTEHERFYMIDYIFYGENTNYLGYFLQCDIDYNQSEYAALIKDEPRVYKLIENAGMSRVGETDNYYLYRFDYERIESDYVQIQELWGKDVAANVEYIPVNGIEREDEYIYISDFGELENEDEYINVIEQIAGLHPRGIIINSEIADEPYWYDYYKEFLDELGVPYYCNNQEFQVIEQEEYYICMIDNTEQVSEEVLDMFRKLELEKKPILLVLSSRVEESERDLLYAELVKENTSVVQILTVQKGAHLKDMLANNIIQFATSADQDQLFNLVRIKELEE